MTENLAHRGFDVTLLEMGDQILGPLDQEMARMVEVTWSDMASTSC